MKRNVYALIVFGGVLLFSLIGCKHKSNNAWLHADDVKVAIDETFKPIMSEQLQQFGLIHPTATLLPLYCSEDSAIRLLLADSVPCCVATRKLTDKEKKYVEDKNLGVSEALIATDAFALIVNKTNPDTTILLSEVKKIVSGEITQWQQLRNSKKKGELKLVFDNSGSSTVRFMKDSLCRGKKLKGNLYAQGSSEAVIQAVKDNPNIIGVVGTDWLRGGKETVLSNFNHLPVSVMLVSPTDEAHPLYYRPYQYYIATGAYPLTRSVYEICTDPRTKSQVWFMFRFLKGQKGQLIFCKNSQLLPAMPVQVKSVNVKE